MVWKMIGTGYCEICEKYHIRHPEYEIYIAGEGGLDGAAPQIYIRGHHTHLEMGPPIDLPPICIWITDFKPLIDELKVALGEAEHLELERRLINLSSQP